MARTAATPERAAGDLESALEGLRSRRLLDPDERFAEILFGLLMVITITGTISATSGRKDVGDMLRAALGCNLAWAIADAVMWILTTLLVRGRGLVLLRAVRGATDPRRAHAVIASALPPALAALVGPAELEPIRRRIAEAPEPPARPALRRGDLLAALGVSLLVFASTLPVVIPFLLVRDARVALRISNGIAIAMLFLLGRAAARHTRGRPWRVGLAMILLGGALVAVIVALGG